MKLSAIKFLVDTSLPAAIVALFPLVSRSSSPTAMLWPINEVAQRKILAAVREHQAAGRDELHKAKLTLRAKDATRITFAEGELRDRLQRIVGNSFAEHVRRKAKTRSQIGFEGQKHRLDIKVRSPNAIEDLKNWSLGYGVRLAVDAAHTTRPRFGISLSKDESRLIGHIEPLEGKPATLEVCNPRTSWRRKLDVRIWTTPDGIGRVLRISAGCLEIEIGFDAQRATLSWLSNQATRISIEQFSGALLFWEAASEGGQVVLLGATDLPLNFLWPELPGNLLALAQTLERVLRAHERCGRRQEPLEIAPSHFGEWHQRNGSVISLVAGQGNVSISVETGGLRPPETVDALVAVRIPASNGYYIAITNTPVGLESFDGSEAAYKGGPAAIVDEGFFENAEVAHRFADEEIERRIIQVQQAKRASFSLPLIECEPIP